MAIQELDGPGDHVYRNVQLVPRDGRLLSSNADGFHSADVDHAPLFDNVHLDSMGDDYFNFQTSLLFVMGVEKAAGGGQLLTVLHPHVSDQPDNVPGITDEWYGTTEPLLRVRGGDELLVYDPVTMTPMGGGKVIAAGFGARVLSTTSESETSPIGKAANALYDVTRRGSSCKPTVRARPGRLSVLSVFPSKSVLCGAFVWTRRARNSQNGGFRPGQSPQPCVPYDFPSFTKQHYPQQRWRASVYEVALDAATPLPSQTRPGAMAAVSYVLQIAKTQTTGARVINSLFEDSTAFFGRWKSSHSLLQNCTFRTNANPELEMQLIGSFYEGPITITNVTIKGNTFEVNKRSKEDGTMRDIITMDGDGRCCNVTGLRLEGNTIKLISADDAGPSKRQRLGGKDAAASMKLDDPAAAELLPPALPLAPSCGTFQHLNTLGFLHHEKVVTVATKDAAGCCARCVATASCASWSFSGAKWTPGTPCHLSPYAFEAQQPNSPNMSCGSARPPQPPPPPGPAPTPDPPPPPNGLYMIDTSETGERQVFEGVEVELQSDSIGSDNMVTKPARSARCLNFFISRSPRLTTPYMYGQGMPKDGTVVPDDDNSTIGASVDPEESAFWIPSWCVL
jgi:hypothetical protein